MGNILLTDSCNRTCQFCFAQERLGRNVRRSDARPEDYTSFMSMERIEQLLDLMVASGEKQFRLLGGEPSLHPQFLEIIHQALERDLNVLIFTNLIMPRSIVDALACLPSHRISILANVTPEQSDTPRMKERVEYALQRLHQSTVVSLTITAPGFEYRFLIDLIKKYNLIKRIRVGIGMPIVGRDNQFLATSDYKAVGTDIARMAVVCNEHDILPGFDCGLTMCMFSREEMGVIADCTQGLDIVCHPIIDIGPNGEVWHCFPLSEVLNTHIDEFSTRGQIEDFYRQAVAPYTTIGCMNQCIDCDYKRRGQCHGGCLAHTMKHLDRLPPRRISVTQ
ncbi:MAG: radical SAM protein [Leptospiraceae bacterium]|nr:radical SAM protein [Leptospiraceae bacterium]